ncbi:MAG: hypothetical protein ACJA2M_001182 [Polaribacter sp.]|jgi:hypothetical protein
MSAEAIALFAATSASALRKLNYYFVSQRTEFAQKKRAQKDIKRKSLLYFFACFFAQLVLLLDRDIQSPFRLAF